MTESPPLSDMTGTCQHDAIVVFGDQVGLFWLRILRPGFRHCFVLLELEDGWVMLDPLAHWMHVAILPPVPSDELAAWYRDRGYHVAISRHDQPSKQSVRWAPFTCVEIVKRALGIRRFGIWTPHQLWCFLIVGKKS